MRVCRPVASICALFILVFAEASSAAATTSHFSCFVEKLKGLLGTQIVQAEVNQKDLAAAFSGNSNYKFLSQLFSERGLGKFRSSPESIATKTAVVNGGKFEFRQGPLFVTGRVEKSWSSIKVVVGNVQIMGGHGNFHGFNTETDGLKTGLAKVLTGVYEGLYLAAARDKAVSRVEIVAEEILNTKLAQALSHIGFYSKKAGRRLTDDEIKAVAFNLFLQRGRIEYSESVRPEELINFITLAMSARITRQADQPQPVRFIFSDILPIGDPNGESTRKSLSKAGLFKRNIARILNVINYKVTKHQEEISKPRRYDDW